MLVACLYGSPSILSVSGPIGEAAAKYCYLKILLLENIVSGWESTNPLQIGLRQRGCHNADNCLGSGGT